MQRGRYEQRRKRRCGGETGSSGGRRLCQRNCREDHCRAGVAYTRARGRTNRWTRRARRGPAVASFTRDNTRRPARGRSQGTSAGVGRWRPQVSSRSLAGRRYIVPGRAGGVRTTAIVRRGSTRAGDADRRRRGQDEGVAASTRTSAPCRRRAGASDRCGASEQSRVVPRARLSSSSLLVVEIDSPRRGAAVLLLRPQPGYAGALRVTYECNLGSRALRSVLPPVRPTHLVGCRPGDGSVHVRRVRAAAAL